MEHATDIVIVGGGLNGPALALALAQGGFRVAVVDARPEALRTATGFDGRAYALALASVRALETIGVWAGVRDLAQPIRGIRTAQGHAGHGALPGALAFDHAEIAGLSGASDPQAGALGQMVEDRHLYAAFLGAMRAEPRISLHMGARVVTHEVADRQAVAHLDNLQAITAGLIVACDGRDSPTARRAGITRWGHDYGQTALVCAIDHARPHDGIAHQFFMPPGPLAILPLPGNRSSIVWSERTDTARAIAGLDDAGYLAQLRPRFGAHLGEIALAGARFSYPLRLTVADRFIAPRLALVGDAAHGVHPIAGQGLNLGLRDVAALAEVLILARRRGEDFAAPDVLARYQDWRRPDTVAMALAMDGVNRLFSNANPLLTLARGLGMGVVNALPGLRRTLIREAAGLDDTHPRLLRGLPV